MVKNKSYNRDKANEKELRINYRIKARKIRLIYEGGDQEILDIELAIEKAKTAGLDLVEISPNVDPPVCKILDYGKYKFQQEKRQKETKKHQKVVKLKEIRMQPKIDSHDLAFKSKHILDFLIEGDKVKVTVRFRGRELAHTQIGVKILENILQTLGENNFMLEIAPKMEGKSMFMIIAPKGKK